MIQYQIPVRVNVPQQFTYTFKDQNLVPIPLDLYGTVSLEVKLQGIVFSTVMGTVQSPPSAGVVQCAIYTFTQIGIWSVQFYCQDGSGNKLFGEPLQIRVVQNVEDLGLSQLLVY